MAQKALHFVGDATKYARRASNESVFDLDSGGTGKTWGAQIKITDVSLTQVLFEKRDAGDAAVGWTAFFDSSNLHFGFYFDYLGGGAVWTSAHTVVVDTWYSLFWRYTYHSAIAGFVDGVNRGSAGIGGGITPGTNGLTLGKAIAGGNPPAPAKCELRNLTYWNRALSDDEIAIQGTGDFPRSPYQLGTSLLTGLAAHWPLSGDALDWSDGAGGGGYPLSLQGGLDFASATPDVLGLPASPVVAPPPPAGFGGTAPTVPFAGSADFGLDVSTFSGLDPALGPLSGPKVAAQAVARRFRTPRGSLLFHPDYGFDLRQLVNADLTRSDLHRIRAAIQSEAEKDERVVRADTGVEFNRSNQTLTATVMLLTGAGPFKLVLTVDKLSVSDNLG